jgi:hypothetical protein
VFEIGAYWLNGSVANYPALDVVIRSAGLSIRTWDGWQSRSRSSGGFNSVLGIVVHHTASPSTQSFDNDWSYCAVGHPDAPVANMLLGRDGLVGLHAGGASNHAGKGGPWSASKGTIPLDSANSYAIGIEAQNNGVGENWAPEMVDAYERLCKALCDAYHLNPLQDIMAHFEWAPSRKIDPWGGNQATTGHPYTGPREWIMRGGNGFCDAVKNKGGSLPPPVVDDTEGLFVYPPSFAHK